MKKAILIGHPVAHSRSPAIFRFIAERVGEVDLKYESLDISPTGLDVFMQEVRKGSTSKAELLGFNVTIPHKETIIKYLDRVSDKISNEARLIGAVNVVHITDKGFYGFNTDAIGIERTIASNKIDTNRVFLWGAGGAARAVAYVFGKLGATQVVIYNRNVEKAKCLANEMGTAFKATKFQVISQPDEKCCYENPFDCFVNATSIGMAGPKSDRSDRSDGTAGVGEHFESLQNLPKSREAAAFDLIYTPLETPFLLTAKKVGLRTIGGLEMLIEQAVVAWEIWLGPWSKYDVDELKLLKLKQELFNFIANSLADPWGKKIVLTGFMASGKSTIGALLAEKCGVSFIDTDHLIEQRAGLSVAEIFRLHGETEFRRLEKDIIVSLLAKTSAPSEGKEPIIALGGGALEDPETLGLVNEKCLLVNLVASASTIQNRLKNSQKNTEKNTETNTEKNTKERPLLAGLDQARQLEKIKEIMKQREPTYAKAVIQLTTDNLTPEQVVCQLRKRVGEL